MIQEIKDKIASLQKERNNLNKIINENKSRIDLVDKILYELNIKVAHIEEIYRLAQLHFNRLKNQNSLTPSDYAEIEKWIKRAKTLESLENIVKAFNSLSKFYPKDIKSNLYGLVQKIIIEGPFKKTLNNS